LEDGADLVERAPTAQQLADRHQVDDITEAVQPDTVARAQPAFDARDDQSRPGPVVQLVRRNLRETGGLFIGEGHEMLVGHIAHLPAGRTFRMVPAVTSWYDESTT
jgi:hypothetical protein